MNISRRAVLGTALAPLLTAGVAGAQSDRGILLPNGLWPAMLTPFNEDKSVDWKALDALTDWYVANGADGLFACCQSSEVWSLTEDERLRVASVVAKRAGKIPVVAGGLPGFVPETVSPFVARLADLGLRGAVLMTCQVAEKAESDELWQQRVEAMLNASRQLPFGLYESPSPYKRLLSPHLMRWAGRTGRINFLKDTTCDIGMIQDRVKAVAGTPFKIFNAHVPILVASVRSGGHGFCGIAANGYPNVVSYATHHAGRKPGKVDEVQQFLTVSEATLGVGYPLSAKILASMAGVPIKPVCRKNVRPIDDAQIAKLRELRKAADGLLG